MKKTAKPKKQDSTSKRRKILLGIFIPIAAVITTTAIVLGVKSCKDKQKSQNNVIVRNAICVHSYVALNEQADIEIKPEPGTRILGISRVLVGGNELFSPGQYTFDKDKLEITIEKEFMLSTFVEIDVNANAITAIRKVEYSGPTQVGNVTKASDWKITGKFTNGIEDTLEIGKEYRIFYNSVDITDQINSETGFKFTVIKNYDFVIKSGKNWAIESTKTIEITEVFKRATVNFNSDSFSDRYIGINDEWFQGQEINQKDGENVINYEAIPTSWANGNLVVKNSNGDTIKTVAKQFESGVTVQFSITIDDWSQIDDNSTLTLFWEHTDKTATLKKTTLDPPTWISSYEIVTASISEANNPQTVTIRVTNSQATQHTANVGIYTSKSAKVVAKDFTLAANETKDCVLTIPNWQLINYDSELTVQISNV